MNIDISLDLETLSTRSNAAIVSIGAAAFDRTTGEIVDTLYMPVQIDTSDKFHVDGGTIAWWMAQSDAARAVFAEDGVPLSRALLELTMFHDKFDSACVWGNGSIFDVSILENAYRAFYLGTPWIFRNVRDMRTVVDLARVKGFDIDSIPFEGTAHNALADAVHQAKVIAACIEVLTGPGQASPEAPADLPGSAESFLG